MNMPKPYHTPKSERDDARGQEILREMLIEVERIDRELPHECPECGQELS